MRGGSTAVVGIVRDSKLHMAWAGDARGIVFMRGPDGKLVANPIVVPHSPFGVSRAFMRNNLYYSRLG